MKNLQVATVALKVLHCNDANCSGGDESVTSPDSSGKVLHCANPDCDSDTDNDGCADVAEQQTLAGSETSGGLRNAKNPWDYFNPTGDAQNGVDDILAVVYQYFKDDNDATPGFAPFTPGYTHVTDRTSAGPNLWNTGPPNGLQRVDDILNIINQYFHDCA